MENSTSEQIYVFIHAYLKHHRYAPRYQDIADACQVSTTTARKYVQRLEADGRIRRQPRRVRSLHLPTH
jgi:DNA-binding GntR family transcriptional regulator